MELELLVSNLSPTIRREQRDGRTYLVADATLIVPGVLNGSRGRLYYPPDEVSKNPQQWDKTPMVVYHPRVGDNHVSAQTPGVLDDSGIGFIERNRYEDKHKSELWFDEERTNNYDKRLKPDHKIMPRLLAGKPISLSTGLYTDNIAMRGKCPLTGREYDAVARNYRPDHLAILPDQQGACSINDGCGVNVNADAEQSGPTCKCDGTCEKCREKELQTTDNSNPEGCNQYKDCAGGGAADVVNKLKEMHTKNDVENWSFEKVDKIAESLKSMPVADLKKAVTDIYGADRDYMTKGSKTKVIEGVIRNLKERIGSFVRTEQINDIVPPNANEYIERVEQVITGNMRLDDLLDCQADCDDDEDCVDDCLDELAGNAAGVHGNPKSFNTGKFKPIGSGYGKGEVHEAAQRGGMLFTERDRELGGIAKSDTSWVEDVETWNKAKAAADKGYNESDDQYWAVVAHIYQKMGGTVKDATTNSNPEGLNQLNQEGTTVTRDEAIKHLTTNCDCWKGAKDVLNSMTNERLLKLIEAEKKATANAKLVANAACGEEPMAPAAEKEVPAEEEEETTVPPPAKKKGPPMMNSRLTPEEQEYLASAKRITDNAKRQIIRQLVTNVVDAEKQKKHVANLQKKTLAELEDMLELRGPTQNQEQERQDDVSWFFGAAGGAPVHNARRFTEDDIKSQQQDVIDMTPPTINYEEEAKLHRKTA